MQERLIATNTKATAEQADSFNRAFSFVFVGYEGDWYWWEAVIVFRKTLISLTGALLSRDPLGQSICVMIILFVSAVSHTFAKPFIENWADDYELLSLSSSFMLYAFGSCTITTGASPLSVPASYCALVTISVYMLYSIYMLFWLKFKFNQKGPSNDISLNPRGSSKVGIA